MADYYEDYEKNYKVTGNQYLSLKLTPKYTVHTYAQICLKKNLNYVKMKKLSTQ